MTDRDFLKRIFAERDIHLDDSQFDKFDSYGKLLVEWNEKINLTAITQPEEICVKHFLDSVLPFKLLGRPVQGKLLDVGTGAGFPSCPLKICYDGVKLTLLDSLNKRINFLTQLSEQLELSAECIHGRAEELGKSAEQREKYDIVTARAVARLNMLCEFCLPFVKVGGIFAALKGPAGEEEASQAENAVKVLGGRISEVKKYTLPDSDMRTLVVVEKIAPTPSQYPRNKGRMDKKPL